MSETPDKIPGQPEISEPELMKLFPTAAKIAQTTPSDFLKAMFSQLARNDSKVESILLGIFSGIPTVDFDVPEWVKRASRKFIEGIGLKRVFVDENADWVTWMDALGYGFGMIEDLLQKPDSGSANQSHKKKLVAPMMGEFKTFASNSNAENSAAFFNARLEGEKSRESADQLTVRAKIAMIIAMYWQDVESMKSTAELHEFLFAQRMPNGKKMFPSNIDSRETRRVCESIGLRFDNSWSKKKSKI